MAAVATTKGPIAVDIGFNACSSQFKRDLPAVVARAAAAGVAGVLITGVDMKSSFDAKKLCESNRGMLKGIQLAFCAGVHPHDAKKFVSSGAKEKIGDLCKSGYCFAVGECGLDFNRDFSPRDVQKSAFTEQVKLAAQLQMPLFLHERDAHEAFLEVMDAHWTKEKHAVVHCFTGTEAQAAAYIERGMFIGLTGTVCMPRRGATLRAMLCSTPPTIPLDKLLLETDAPFMHPFSQGGVAVPTAADPATVYKPEGGGAQGGKGGARKRRCEPADLTWVIKTVAACYGVSEEHVAMQTAANASTVFGFGGHVNLPSTANLETTSEAVATAVATAAASSGGAQAQRPPTAAASAAAAGGGSTTNFAPELTPLQQECVQQALSSPFVDSHVHLDEVLSALKIGIPGLADEGGAGGSQEDADLAAAIAASLGHATPPVAQPGATHAAGASSSSSGNDTSASALHPRLAQLVGEPCQGLVAQFCDPASVSPSLGVWEALLCLGGVYGAFGCHPHHAKHYSESWEGRIREALTHPKAVALGECGLDYHRSASPRDVQQQVFARQLLLAVEVGKPVVVHCRNAEADALRIMQEHLPADWLVHLHCYTGNASNAQKFLSAFSNLYIGFTGYITQSHGDAAQTRAAIRDTIPLNRVLFETDGPWMCPRAAGAQADVVAPVLGALYDAGRYRGAKRPGLPGAPAEAGGSKHASARGGKRRGGRSGGGGGGNQQSVGCGKGGRTCHPGCIPAIAAVIAAEKGVSVADAMQQVRRNTSAVYGV